MKYDEILENVSVLGAAGKMGSGILLLTAIEMNDISNKPENKDKQFVVFAIDVSQKALSDLMKYIKVQVQKIAEKKTVQLREVYKDRKDLIENSEIIDEYVFDVLNIIRPVTNMEAAFKSNLIFEAVSENPELKVRLLNEINNNNTQKPWFFTNTSSVPINQLDKSAQLDGSILGFHFYNPPAVQRLVELIITDNTKKEMVEFANEFAKKLRKKIVPSNDFAGFIGNGHFMRDALHGINESERLSESMPFVEAVYTMNKISQDFLIRPMGIFQLIDYVGIDVCQYIMKVMDPYLENENLHSPLLDKMISLGVRGGQNPDGSQKDGFFKYEKNRPIAIYDPDQLKYIEIANFKNKCDEEIGPLPDSHIPWKAVIGNPAKEKVFEKYFAELNISTTPGSDLAKKYALRSKEIGLKLVEDHVAKNQDDVNTVLLTGFYHAYGPVNNYVSEEVE